MSSLISRNSGESFQPTLHGPDSVTVQPSRRKPRPELSDDGGARGCWRPHNRPTTAKEPFAASGELPSYWDLPSTAITLWRSMAPVHVHNHDLR